MSKLFKLNKFSKLFVFRLNIIFTPIEVDNALYSDIVAEPANRATTSRSRGAINKIEKVYYHSGTSSLQMLEENYKTLHSGIVFKEYSPFFETYNEIKGWLESNGIMEKFRQNNKILRIEPEELGPQVLTMDHLRLGFLACLIVAAVSVAAFFGELMWPKLIIAFREKMQKVYEEKQEIVTVDKNNLIEEDLIEVCSSVDENLMVVEELVEKVVLEAKMCEDKPALNHIETSQESHNDTDSIDELINALTSKAL